MSEITINLHDIPCGNCTVCIGRTIGAKHEQERIIKLLIDKAIEWRTNYLHKQADYIDFTIELIKGEK